MSDVTLFYPKTGRDLRIQYPELRSIPEFARLKSAKEMLFVWYWSNPTSPIDIDLPYKQRLDLCFENSGWKPSEEIVRAFYENVWPESTKTACSRMEKFETEMRNQARKVYKKIFANFSKFAEVNDSDFKVVGEDNEEHIDFAARKQYVEYATKIAQEMPDILKKMEEGFGTDDPAEIKSTEKAIETWHKSNQ